MKKITLSKDNAKLIGRTFSKGGALWLGLSGTGAEFVFTGKIFRITIKGDEIAVPGNEDSYTRIAVYADGKRVFDEIVDFNEKTFDVLEFEEEKTADIRIIKLSEAAMSSCAVEVVTDDGARVEPAAGKAHKIEFIGDSITCGYGVDDEDENHQFSTSTEDVTRAYAYKTADALNADYSMFSASGYGIISGYTEEDVPKYEETIPQFYESMGFSYGSFDGVKPQNIKWDFGIFVPDVIVVNLGTNDDSYCRDFSDRQQVFEKEYAKFLERVRALNPTAYIFCTVGIMGERIYSAVESGCKAYAEKTGDKRITAMRFSEQNGAEDGYAANWHPTEKTHIKAAETLTEKIRNVMDW